MLEDFQGDSWGSIPPLHMSSLLPHDLCHGQSASLWPPTGCHDILQEIFLTQRSNKHLLCLQDWQAGFFFLPLAPLRASLVAQLVKNLPVCRRPGFNPWVGKIPWRREWLPTPVFWPGELHGLYSRKESDTTEWLSLTHSTWKPINTGHRAKIKTWIFTLYMMAGHIFVQHYYWMLKFSPVWHRANRLRTILTIIVITAIDFLEWREQQRKN